MKYRTVSVVVSPGTHILLVGWFGHSVVLELVDKFPDASERSGFCNRGHLFGDYRNTAVSL